MRPQGRQCLAVLRDRRGGSLLEFGLIALPMVLLMGGLLEFAVLLTTASMLDSASLQAARYGATGAQPSDGTREEMIRQIIQDRTFGLVDMDRLVIETQVYQGFDSIDQAEGFDDANANDAYDDGESFTDVNGNGSWDADQGAPGLGQAEEVVVYEVRYPWEGITGLMKPIVQDLELTSSVPVRNEPFNQQ
ncbi:TadE/TadG family type IV pilus assembly protein [Rhodovibrio salinarum]|uniref:Pilus assembly protein n=1 Tax=Rhodovibrio salinarum TaxID=1087 RepID=A0A934QGL7_9PROT|nr:TadE/TadG family type IV pilus assembly protein [Rhodovibrio salinarum]MBK1696287.1 pilus assembly protein [Rhodovibrio salinarum]